MIKKILRLIYDRPFCDHLRALLGVRPPIFLRPLRTMETVSDLFPWRVDDTWETQFELTNLPSFLEAEILIENRRKEYNQIRLHSSQGYRPRAAEAIQPVKMEILT